VRSDRNAGRTKEGYLRNSASCVQRKPARRGDMGEPQAKGIEGEMSHWEKGEIVAWSQKKQGR